MDGLLSLSLSLSEKRVDYCLSLIGLGSPWKSQIDQQIDFLAALIFSPASTILAPPLAPDKEGPLRRDTTTDFLETLRWNCGHGSAAATREREPYRFLITEWKGGIRLSKPGFDCIVIQLWSAVNKQMYGYRLLIVMRLRYK